MQTNLIFLTNLFFIKPSKGRDSLLLTRGRKASLLTFRPHNAEEMLVRHLETQTGGPYLSLDSADTNDVMIE